MIAKRGHFAKSCFSHIRGPLRKGERDREETIHMTILFNHKFNRSVTKLFGVSNSFENFLAHSFWLSGQKYHFTHAHSHLVLMRLVRTFRGSLSSICQNIAFYFDSVQRSIWNQRFNLNVQTKPPQTTCALQKFD